jgi:hypothetical protein
MAHAQSVLVPLLLNVYSEGGDELHPLSRLFGCDESSVTIYAETLPLSSVAVNAEIGTVNEVEVAGRSKAVTTGGVLSPPPPPLPLPANAGAVTIRPIMIIAIISNSGYSRNLFFIYFLLKNDFSFNLKV